VKADENGECPQSSEPVETDYEDIIKWLNECKGQAYDQAAYDKKNMTTTQPLVDSSGGWSHYP
jgi:hypothetical protein